MSWGGLIISGLAVIFLFRFLWVGLLLYRQFGLNAALKLEIPRIAESVIFLLIGLLMMKSGVKKRGSGKGEKATVFWVGLLILGVASNALFDVIWNDVVIYKIYRYAPINLPVIAGTILFILIGLCMMKSDKGERTTVFWVGLIILGLASVGLFQVLWRFAVAVWSGYIGTYSARSLVPPLFGGVVFILIGLYMMISGERRREERRFAEERPVAVVYCSSCGTQNLQDAVYCKKCGKKLSTG